MALAGVWSRPQLQGVCQRGVSPHATHILCQRGRYQVQRLLGQGGESLVSPLLKELTDRADDSRFRQAQDVELKGLLGVHQEFMVGWE